MRGLNARGLRRFLFLVNDILLSFFSLIYYATLHFGHRL